MAPGTCEKPDCTMAVTGKCLLLQANVVECPHFLADSDDSEIGAAEQTRRRELKAPPNDKAVSQASQLGGELGVEDALATMGGHYSRVLGVLGSTDAAVSFMTSLYESLSLAAPYAFAGSRTLLAFEALARRERDRKAGRLPDQLVDELTDPRRLILHLALRETKGERRSFDLLLSSRDFATRFEPSKIDSSWATDPAVQNFVGCETSNESSSQRWSNSGDLPAVATSLAVKSGTADKGNINLLMADGQLKRSVTLEIASRYAGVGRRAIEKAARKALKTEGKGPHRRVLVKSLLKYSPPEVGIATQLPRLSSTNPDFGRRTSRDRMGSRRPKPPL